MIVWITRDLNPPKKGTSWYLPENDELYFAPTNVHSVVLTGYGDTFVNVMDPLTGQTTHSKDVFFASYEALGKHAVIVK